MDRADIPLPADCVNVAEWEIVDDHPDHPDHHGYRHVAQTNVNLPISSDLLYFFSRGSLSHGVIRFVDSGAENSDVASVDVRFLYNEQNLIDFAKVCHLQKDDSKNGVGIFSPSWVNHPRDHHHRTAFDVVVTLPTSAWIETLETNMPLFVHELEDFRNTIYFSSISLSTTNVPIHAEYLSAAKARLRTTNSNIAGTINATEVIDLNTSNAPINAQLVLTNEDTGSPSRITAHTSNSNVKLDISLASAAKDNKGGVFKVDVTSSNGPLDVQYSAAPVGSKLDFRGTTSNSPARVTTHETFEGTFLLTTGRWFDAAVHVNGNAEDPAGEGRQRRLTTRISQKGRAEGKVVWDSDSGKELGSVQIQTSNSPAHLFV
ncbi:hypothetical protein BDW22DRAFT_1337119 [Trametopsis cervina]|nr:hypothetical protein BDW22DRAFT_1337119 [Trametopsis cervina]